LKSEFEVWVDAISFELRAQELISDVGGQEPGVVDGGFDLVPAEFIEKSVLINKI
jgi:hypothetical protein